MYNTKQNIKQKFIKFTISFLCLILISACQKSETSIRPKNKAINVAVLLPISGKDAQLGNEYIKMIELGIKSASKAKIEVHPYDASNPELLNQSLIQILSNKTDIIVGPIHSEATKITAEKTREKGIPIFSLSNNPELIKRNPDSKKENLFIYGHAPVRQIEQITNYFIDNNYQNYITLMPSGQYSTNVNKVLQSIITDKEANFVHQEFYDKTPESIENSVKLLSEIVDDLNENDFNLTQPVILIADDAETLRMIYNNVRKYNLDRKAIFAGNSKIDIASPSPINITFTGSIYISDQTLLSQVQEASEIKHISYMHAVAYDAGKMIATSIGDGYNKTKFLAKMNSDELFFGTSGRIKFINYTAQRQYDILTKKRNDNHATSRQ